MNPAQASVRLRPKEWTHFMKDSIALLVTAVVMAFFAWLFWSTLGPDAFVVLGSLMVVMLCTDNFRLRRQVKALQAGAAKKA
ncbi:hypothetical protein HBB04_02423 [Pseudomonas coronafaciens]|nr:hypothetical protein HBB04_02423 [Pseudomonas coronafaciens]